MESVKEVWDIEDIQYEIENENQLIDNFRIYSDLEIIPNLSNFKIRKTVDLINIIENSAINTGVMISSMLIQNKHVYILILDKSIFIINHMNIYEFGKYLKNHSKFLIFSTPQIKKYIENIISIKTQISEQTDELFNETKNHQSLKNEIIRCIIKKSQYRTLQMHHNMLFRKYNLNNVYEYRNFIRIGYLKTSLNIEICYNLKEQILNVLKPESKHENEFYQQIDNSFPFICKLLGKTQPNNYYHKIVLEYIEGENLDDFIIRNKFVDFSTKIKIIIEILFAVYYAHSNGFYLRDLKPDNIIIDYQNNAFLVDFDNSKEINSPINKENTGNIGYFIYTAPEQLYSNEY